MYDDNKCEKWIQFCVRFIDLITLASVPKTENDNLITSLAEPLTPTQLCNESNTHSDVQNSSDNDRLLNGHKDGND